MRSKNVASGDILASDGNTFVKDAKNKLQVAKEEREKIKDILSQLADLPDVTSIWMNIDL